MNKIPKESRFKVKSDEDRRIGIRILYIRRCDFISQKSLADEIGLTAAQMANVESGRVSLRLLPGWGICKTFFVNPGWLATGRGSMPLDYRPKEEWKEVEAFAVTNAKVPFMDAFQQLEDLIRSTENSKLLLTSTLSTVHSVRVSSEKEIPTWKQLVAKLKKLTETPGTKTRLAADIGTSRQNIHKWLTSDAEPGAELTLKVYQWVKDHEK